MRRRVIALAIAVVTLAATGTITSVTTTQAAPTPIRAAFYYPWFPETWGNPPFSHYQPTAGYYDSSNASVIRTHVQQMKRAGIQAGIASWWGQGTQTDSRIPKLLSVTKNGFHWTLYYEQEGYSNPSSSAISADLSYIASRYTAEGSYLRVDGKPVLFVYADGADGCSMVDRWMSANAGRFYLVLKVFPGYTGCSAQPNSWHQYAPAVRSDSQLPYSYSVSPGFWLANESSPRLSRSTTDFNAAVAAMAASGAQWQLVTTFNEWGEGSAVEPSTIWGNTYLDILAANGTLLPPPTSTPPPTTPPPTTIPPTTPPPGTFVVGAAGDICGACSATSNLVIAQNPNLVLTLGDNAYNAGTATEFSTLYNPYWGRFKSKTQPSTGNHDWGTPNAQGYRDYFGFPSGPLYSSYDAGGWHFVRMDTNSMNTTQSDWIAQDLAANNAQCEIGYGHHPRWSSGDHGSQTTQTAAWNAMAAANVDIVLYGHDHDYERFGLIDGVREFVVGTGGASHYAFHTPIAGSEVRIANVYGVLFLTLGNGTYSWRFLDTNGSVQDSGSGVCH